VSRPAGVVWIEVRSVPPEVAAYFQEAMERREEREVRTVVHGGISYSLLHADMDASVNESMMIPTRRWYMEIERREHPSPWRIIPDRPRMFREVMEGDASPCPRRLGPCPSALRSGAPHEWVNAGAGWTGCPLCGVRFRIDDDGRTHVMDPGGVPR